MKDLSDILNERAAKDRVAVNVRDFGAKGDGITDDRAAIQAALDSGANDINFPVGDYAVSGTLLVGSDICLHLSRCTRLILKGGERKRRGDFLISNKNPKEGNSNITIAGGIFDGNNTDPANAKPDIFDKDGYSGAVMNFVGVDGLNLMDITVANSTTYYIRMSRVDHFFIRDINFVSDFFGHNQDGIHIGGGVRNGVITNIRALSVGQTNDDMIAFNADDSVERVENLDLERDAIENIIVNKVYAANCYTVFRMLSVDAPIRNIQIKDVYAGYRNYAINADAARYCKTPLFCEEDRPLGVGSIENVEINNFTCYPVFDAPKNNPAGQVDPSYAIRLECHADNFVIKNFRLSEVPGRERAHALLVANTPGVKVMADGREYEAREKTERILIDSFSELKITGA